jgi:hypothetical protein
MVSLIHDPSDNAKIKAQGMTMEKTSRTSQKKTHVSPEIRRQPRTRGLLGVSYINRLLHAVIIIKIDDANCCFHPFFESEHKYWMPMIKSPRLAAGNLLGFWFSVQMPI